MEKEMQIKRERKGERWTRNYGSPPLYSLLPLRTKTTKFQMHETPLINGGKKF